MNKQVSVADHEILLVVCDDDYPYAEFGPFEETEILDIVNGLDDVEIILRINLTSNCCFDISEEVAEIYVKNSDSSLLECKTHPFIKDSRAYHLLSENVSKEIYADEVYGTYEEQHRLRPCDVLNMNYRRI
ncbi:hypothetical protein [Bartonella sp. WD12.1]|uniref:hypothetical protein n=1 Tax=Bartonella sp. WD12.1 TaxID=1933903 RepID=UPI000999AD62|nr:hypothetical protein [Bartonella sp. WD12.1]OPB29550.1 hypothetical protein BWD121_005700 [Bartonella sp. WD12.1]